MTKGRQVWALPSMRLGAGGTPPPSVLPESRRFACPLCCLPSHGTQIFLFQLDVMSYNARLQPKFTFPHYCNCSARYCNLKSAASDHKSTEVWNLLSHLLHCGTDVLHIASGIWLLPCLSSLLRHLSSSPPTETGEQEHQGGKKVVCCAQGTMLTENIDAARAQT